MKYCELGTPFHMQMEKQIKYISTLDLDTQLKNWNKYSVSFRSMKKRFKHQKSIITDSNYTYMYTEKINICISRTETAVPIIRRETTSIK